MPTRQRVLTDEEIAANVAALDELRGEERQKYNNDIMPGQVVDVMARGGTQYECCLNFGICEQTFYEWVNPSSPYYHKDFARAVELGRAAFKNKLNSLALQAADGSNKDVNLAAINKLERQTVKPVHTIHEQPLLIQEYLKALKAKDYELASEKLDEAVLHGQIGTQRYELMSSKLEARIRTQQGIVDKQNVDINVYQIPDNGRMVKKEDKE